jgi:hypothetical protein
MREASFLTVCCVRINVTFSSSFLSYLLTIHSPWDFSLGERERERGGRDKVGREERHRVEPKKITSCQALPRICYTEMHVYSQLQQPEEEEVDARPQTTTTTTTTNCS